MELRVELRPASEDKDLITRVRKPKSLERGSGKPKSRPNERKAGCETEYTRRLEGVLTPLDSPVLQGAALLVYLAFPHAHCACRGGTSDGTPSDRDFGP